MSGLLDDRRDSGLMGDASSRVERVSKPAATSDRGTARKRWRPCQVPAGSRASSVVWPRYGASHNAGQARAFTSRGHDGTWEREMRERITRCTKDVRLIGRAGQPRTANSRRLQSMGLERAGSLTWWLVASDPASMAYGNTGTRVGCHVRDAESRDDRPPATTPNRGKGCGE
jgi:hypothetical protein